jgi:RHS repeat-associated protein
LNYQEVTDLQVTKGTGPTDSFEIYLVSTIETRYIKIKTDYDDRDKDFNFVPAETVATFKNSLSSLIRVYYTYDTREEEYVYDVGGNRVRESITTRGTGTRQYHYYPNTNRLMTDGIYAYTYDPNGNIIAKCTHVLIDSEAAAVLTVGSDYWDTITGSIDGIEPAHEDSWWEYSYDLLNRLTKVHKNGEEVAAYSYNAEGLRIRKQKNGQSTWYAFSLSGKLIYKEKEQTFTNYIYANGQLFAMEEGTLSEVETTRRYLHTDHLGSVVAATNIDGDIVWANDYTPFGETTGANGFNDEFARFTGKEMDPDTGLYYSNARWYDPELGRFITEDPIKDGLNYYVYCANNPLRYTDPTGLRLDDDLETDLKRNDREEIESYNSKIESASSISEAEEMEQKQLELMGEYNRNYDYTSETLYPGSTVSQEYKDKQQRLLLKDGNYLSYTHSGIDRVNGKDMMSPGYYRVIATDDGFVFERIGTDRRFRVLHMNPEELKRIKEGQIFVPGEKMGSYPSHPFGRTTSGTHAHIEETGLNSAGVRGFLNPDTHGDWTPGNVFSGIIEKQIIDKEGNVSWVPVRGWRRTTPR